MRNNALLFVSTIIGVLAIHNATASDLVGSGDRLRMMQKVQGKWQDRCEAFTQQPQKMYRASRLELSYTHLIVSKEIYKDSRCLHAVDKRQTKYRYVLGEPVKTKGGKKAYELNVQAEGSKKAALHPFNLISYEKGALYLGRSAGQTDVNARLQQLDLDNPFKR